MAVTINDVAKEAGVSITTVSRVLNDNYPVKKETREKILKAIEKLNFNPNVAARSLITKKSYTIGVIIPSITNLFFPTIVEAIEETIRTKNYSVFLSNTRGNVEDEKALIQQIIAKQVDGIIVIDPNIENLQSGFYEDISSKTPLIIVNGAPSDCKCNFVSYNEEIGTLEAFSYLYSLGHRKLAFIRGHKSTSYDIKERLYYKFIEDNNLKYKKVINIGDGNSINTSIITQKKIEELLKEEEVPTAIFACNDLMAVGVINACIQLGISVPKDISVVGFDNTLLSSITYPTLTSVDLGMKEVGSTAALELLELIENKDREIKRIVLNTKLIKRNSCIDCTANQVP